MSPSAYPYTSDGSAAHGDDRSLNLRGVTGVPGSAADGSEVAIGEKACCNEGDDFDGVVEMRCFCEPTGVREPTLSSASPTRDGDRHLGGDGGAL